MMKQKIAFFYNFCFVLYVAKWDVIRQFKRNLFSCTKSILKENTKFRWATACLTGKKLIQKGS